MSEKWNILAKYFVGESLSDSEQKYLESVSDDERKEASETMGKVDFYFEQQNINTEKAWQDIAGKMDERKILFRTRLIRAAAAAVILVAVAIGALYVVSGLNTETIQTASTDLSILEVHLPDGTMVSLSHGSKLSYDKDFDGNIRLVKLSGEAFFDVAHNSERPFVIETENTSIKVLGTSFNVYEAQDKTEVFVKTGKVQLIEGAMADNSKYRIDLLPGQTGIYDVKNKSLLKSEHENTNSMAWITRDIEFNLTDLATVIETVTRVYGLDVNVAPSVDLNQKITATFNQQDADYIMEVVAITLDLDLIKTGEYSYRINE